MTVKLRPEDPATDEPFLCRLITETIALELGADNWPEPVRDQLLSLQLANRRHGPQSSFPEGRSRIILLDGEPVGWLFFAMLADEIHLVEIMVLSPHRGKGAGSAAIREVLALAADAGKPVRLTVNVLNAEASRLYERLGFRRAGGDEIQDVLINAPATSSRFVSCWRRATGPYV